MQHDRTDARARHLHAVERVARAMSDAVEAYDSTVDDLPDVLGAYPFAESLDEVSARVDAWLDATHGARVEAYPPGLDPIAPADAVALALQVRARSADAVTAYGRLQATVGGWHPDDRRRGLLAYERGATETAGPVDVIGDVSPADAVAFGALADACEDVLDDRGVDVHAVGLAVLHACGNLHTAESGLPTVATVDGSVVAHLPAGEHAGAFRMFLQVLAGNGDGADVYVGPADEGDPRHVWAFRA